MKYSKKLFDLAHNSNHHLKICVYMKMYSLRQIIQFIGLWECGMFRFKYHHTQVEFLVTELYNWPSFETNVLGVRYILFRGRNFKWYNKCKGYISVK